MKYFSDRSLIGTLMHWFPWRPENIQRVDCGLSQIGFVCMRSCTRSWDTSQPELIWA